MITFKQFLEDRFEPHGNLRRAPKPSADKTGVAAEFKRFKPGQIVTIKKSGKQVKVIKQNDIGLVQAVSTDPADLKVKSWRDFTAAQIKHNLFPAGGHYELMPSELAEDVEVKALKDIDDLIEFHKQGQAAVQYKGEQNKKHAAKIRELVAKREELVKKLGLDEELDLEELEAKKDAWKAKVKAEHPELFAKMKFKNRIEQGVDTTSAEIGDRSYGVFDNDTGEAKVFKLDEGIKSELAALALGAAAVVGVVAGLPNARIDGKSYQLATGQAPATAKTATVQLNGKDTKVKYWEVPGPKHGRSFLVYRPISEGFSDVQKRADQFTNNLSAKLKAKGFSRDRGGLWKDSKGNVISVEIDLDDMSGWIHWATGQMRGAKPRYNESGNDPLSSASDVSQTLLNFATESYKD